MGRAWQINLKDPSALVALHMCRSSHDLLLERQEGLVGGPWAPRSHGGSYNAQLRDLGKSLSFYGKKKRERLEGMNGL